MVDADGLADDATWQRVYLLSEERGEYTRLDWAPGEMPASRLVDNRASAAAFAVNAQ